MFIQDQSYYERHDFPIKPASIDFHSVHPEHIALPYHGKMPRDHSKSSAWIWSTLTPEQQINFCKACVGKAIKSGRTLKPGYDVDDATQETFCKVLTRLANVDKLESDCKRREAQGKPDTLAAVVCRAANSTMEGIAYRHRKDSKVTSQTITTEDGESFDLLDTVAAANDTERAAIIRAELQRFADGLDDTNKTIFKGMGKIKLQGKFYA